MSELNIFLKLNIVLLYVFGLGKYEKIACKILSHTRIYISSFFSTYFLYVETYGMYAHLIKLMFRSLITVILMLSVADPDPVSLWSP